MIEHVSRLELSPLHLVEVETPYDRCHRVSRQKSKAGQFESAEGWPMYHDVRCRRRERAQSYNGSAEEDWDETTST